MSFPTTGILDSFGGADSNPIGSPWTNNVTTGANLTDNLKIVSAHAACTAATISDAYITTPQSGANEEAYTTITTLSDSNLDAAFYLRIVNPHSAGSEQGYVVEFLSGGTIRYHVMTTGSLTQIGSDHAGTWTTNDQLGASIIGTTLQAYVNGVAQGTSATDAAYSAAGVIGLGGKGLATRWTNFGGGTIPAAGLTAPMFRGH